MVKPRFGAGSRGLEIVRDAPHLNFLKTHRQDECVAQELLDVLDQEYTCAILKVSEQDIRTLIMHRQMKGDVTGAMKAVKNNAIQSILSHIAGYLQNGNAIYIQLRLTDKGPMIFEINPRFSSTIKMRSMVGFRDFIWAVEMKKGLPLSLSDIVYERMVYRAYKEIMAYDD